MVQSAADTVPEYLASLPPDRRAAIAAVRDVIRANLAPGFAESMQYGMICYGVPLWRYPDTYNGAPLCMAALASQKQHMAVYLMSVYGSPDEARWFTEAYRKTGKRLDMGKSCVRFRRLEDLPVEVIGEAVSHATVDGLITAYEAARPSGKAKGKPAAKKPAAKKAAAKKPAAKKATAKKPTTKKPAAKKPAAKKPARQAARR